MLYTGDTNMAFGPQDLHRGHTSADTLEHKVDIWLLENYYTNGARLTLIPTRDLYNRRKDLPLTKVADQEEVIRRLQATGQWESVELIMIHGHEFFELMA